MDNMIELQAAVFSVGQIVECKAMVKHRKKDIKFEGKFMIVASCAHDAAHRRDGYNIVDTFLGPHLIYPREAHKWEICSG